MINFELYEPQSAKEAAKPWLEKAKSTFGFVPNLQRMMSESPTLLEGYLTLFDIFGKSGFSLIERQVVYLTANYEHECHYCMAGHSGLAKYAGVPDDVIESLRDGQPIADAKLEALRKFTSAMVIKRGWVEKSEIEAFLQAGYDKQAILDIVLGIAVKVMSNYTNHLASTPLDKQIEGLAWTHPNKR